jgi:hypothetical protein
MRNRTPIRTIAATLAIAASLSPATAAASDIVIRRDGSKALNVPADTTPAPTAANSTDGFQWDDAGLGAGAMLAIALASAGVVSVRGRRPMRVS